VAAVALAAGLRGVTGEMRERGAQLFLEHQIDLVIELGEVLGRAFGVALIEEHPGHFAARRFVRATFGRVEQQARAWIDTVRDDFGTGQLGHDQLYIGEALQHGLGQTRHRCAHVLLECQPGRCPEHGG
jgi:hypothetical protein